jgi:predicted porin
MKVFRVAAASAAAMLLGGADGAFAAPPNTPAVPYVAADGTCRSAIDFFTTPCQLAWYGVRIYGTIDVGLGYQTNGAPLDRFFSPGLTYFPGKMNSGGMFLASPNALSQSNIGLQVKEPLGAGWSFVAQLESAFDPYTLQFASGVGSVHEFIGVPLALQRSNGDASTQGTFYNSMGFFGFSSETWGTLTFMRQNSLMLDGVRAYDPMGGSYAFSLIGFFGATGGGGDTENARNTTTVKYRINFGNYRFGAYGQFGGYELGNSSQGAFQGQFGADFNIGGGIFSADIVGSYTKDAINEGLSGGVSTALATLGAVNPLTPQFLTATISNNTGVMVLAKYTLDRLKLYAGYEWMQFANPSDLITSFTDTAGFLICANCTDINGTTISTTAYDKNKILQVVWAGARYSLTDSIDVVGAYYHYGQNNYATGVTATDCAITSLASSSCAGTQDVVSALIDWKFAAKWDTYIGTMYTKLNGGLDSGYLARDNWETTAGVRFRW